MSWDIPSIPAAGTIATVAGWATKIINCLRYLKGLDSQVPTIQSGLIIDNTDGDEYLKLPLLSTVNIGTTLDAEGEVAFDEQTHQMKEYDGTAVRAIISEADVDDTPVNGATTVPVSSNWAYDLKAVLTTRGDLIRRSASDWERVALGTSGQYLKSDGTDAVWGAPPTDCSEGTYGGNDTVNRTIPHGLSLTPKVVLIRDDQAGGYHYFIYGQEAAIYGDVAGGNVKHAVTIPDATNFYVGNAANYDQSANLTGQTYYWVAIT